MSCEFRRSVHSYSCVLGLVLTSFHLLLSYATWLCVFGFLCLRFGVWIFYDSLFIYLGHQPQNTKTKLSTARPGPGS